MSSTDLFIITNPKQLKNLLVDEMSESLFDY